MSLAELPQLAKLSAKEKLQLVEDLWDSIAASPESVAVTDTERMLLEERWKSHAENPDTALTLEEFKKRLSKHL